MSDLKLQTLMPGSDLAPWDEFVDRSPQGSLFCKSWWLRAACDDFRIAVVRKNGAIVAGVPLPIRSGLRRVTVYRPPMTGSMGVLCAPEGAEGYERRLSHQMAALLVLAEGLPRAAAYTMCCHPSFDNWLPFKWSGFRQTTAYTYVIDYIRDPGRVWAEMDYAKQKNIKRARKLVSVQSGMDAGAFYRHHRTSLHKDGKVISYHVEYLARIMEAARSHDGLLTLHAEGKDGAIHAAIVVVYDSKSAYYIASSIDPDHRNSGSPSLLLLQAMGKLAEATPRFDFEGSMIPGVERSFRMMGARLTPYFEISKGAELLHKVRVGAERILRKLGVKE